jgi:RNA-binding protein NOB1
MHTKASFAEQQLPGWGNVPNPEDWRAVDEANDADEAALLAASTSRIAQHVQQLSLDPTAPNSFLQDGAPTAAAAAAAGGSSTQGPAAPLTPEAVSGGGPRTAVSPLIGPTAAAGGGSSPAPQQQQQQQQQQQEQEGDGAAAGSTAAAGDAGEAGGEGEGADGWEVAASSKGAARHRKRKAVKRQQHQQAFEQEWEEHSQLVQQQQQEQEPEPEQQQTHSTAVGAQQQAETQQEQQQEQEDGDAAAAEADAAGSRAAADATNEELLAEEHCVYTADDADEQQQQQHSSPAQQQQQQQRGGPGSRGWQSSVAIITGDFAMQNVLLQMGLRLLTKDGRRIARLMRYALRCSACFTVTRDPGRLFCPKCGNLSLDRVEVVVGADGAEYFGVTKRHILRGTRFSLPKPKVGPEGCRDSGVHVSSVWAVGVSGVQGWTAAVLLSGADCGKLGRCCQHVVGAMLRAGAMCHSQQQPFLAL